MPGRTLVGTFEIFKGDSDGLYCFRYRSSYGAALMESVECYQSKDGARSAIRMLMDGARDAKIVDLTSNGIDED